MTTPNQRTKPRVIKQWHPLALLATTLAHVVACIYFVTLSLAAAGAYIGLDRLGFHPGISLSTIFAVFLLPMVGISFYCTIKAKGHYGPP